MSDDKKLSRQEIEQFMKTDPWWKEISDEIDRVYMLHRLNEIVSDEQKSEVTQAMFEYLLISEENLANAHSDPVFTEAKTIIEGLNSGDSFPDRLVDLCNSKVPEALHRIDQVVSALIPLLSITTVQTEVERLWANDRAAFESVDINQLPRNLYVSSPDDRYIIRCLRKLAQLDSQFRNNRLYPFGSDTYVPAAVSASDDGHIAVRMGAVNESAVGQINRRAEYLAYRVYDPLWAQQMECFEPEYVSFKFKWLNDAELLSSLYERYKRRQDVSSVFVSFYKNEDRLIRLQNAISSVPSRGPTTNRLLSRLVPIEINVFMFAQLHSYL